MRERLAVRSTPSLLLALGCTGLVLGCAGAAPENRADAGTKRSPPAGEVIGFKGSSGADVYLGLPYAQPPTGERRWRAPAPAAPWTGVREALHLAAACPQFPSRFGGLQGSAESVQGNEDCLYLNVYTPPLSADGVPTGD